MNEAERQLFDEEFPDLHSDGGLSGDNCDPCDEKDRVIAFFDKAISLHDKKLAEKVRTLKWHRACPVHPSITPGCSNCSHWDFHNSRIELAAQVIEGEKV